MTTSLATMRNQRYHYDATLFERDASTVTAPFLKRTRLAQNLGRKSDTKKLVIIISLNYELYVQCEERHLICWAVE